jgi:hypothetical protein
MLYLTKTMSAWGHTMRLKIGFLLIILATSLAIGLINFTINETSKVIEISNTRAPRNEPKLFETKTHDYMSSNKTPINLDLNKKAEPQDKTSSPKTGEKDESYKSELSPEEIEKITHIAYLSESELTRELERLKMRIEEDDLINGLENKNLSKEREIETKEILERFALLGLEGTRRKYMEVEPELKDAFYAHRKSLKEIKELLDGMPRSIDDHQ